MRHLLIASKLKNNHLMIKSMPREKITTEFGSTGEWDKEVEKYEKGEDFNVYARYNYPELIKREKELAEMIGAEDCALFNAGMAAIETAVEAEDLKPGDVILCGRDVYDQTKELYKLLINRGVKIVEVDSGNMEEIEEKVKNEKPRLIILESVANAQNMQVCDIKKLVNISESANSYYQENLTAEKLIDKYFSKGGEVGVEKTKELLLKGISEFRKGNNPFVFREAIREFEKVTGMERVETIRDISRAIKFVFKHKREKLSLIIDNTLASPALYNPLNDSRGSGVDLTVVESATKHYQKGQDKITMGIAYSYDKEKIKKIKEIRSIIGTYLQPDAEKEIPEDIAKVMPEIMKRHAENALELAELISSSGKAIEVSHPNLPEHKQNELVREIAPEGIVTLFYMKIKDAPGFINKVKEIGDDKIGVGGSFGHPKTWMLNLGEEVIRIAAGSEKDEKFQEVLNIFKKALENYEKK
jgi:cystathionine beta-lyase/cystathionine gamma-synthase